MIAVLKRAVTDSGLSFSELAKRSGVDHSQISRFMRGERLLALDSASRLLDSLGFQMVRLDESAGIAEPEPLPTPRIVSKRK